MNKQNKGTVTGLDLDSIFSSDAMFRCDLKRALLELTGEFIALKASQKNLKKIMFSGHVCESILRIKNSLIEKMSDIERDKFGEYMVSGAYSIKEDMAHYIDVIKNEIDLIHESSYLRIAAELKHIFLIAERNTKKQLSHDELITYAVIGAMAITGGDAEEAARLLGVTVDFINERF